MKDNTWINNPSLNNMNPRKKEILIDLMNEADGKSMHQCIPIILKANTKIKSAGLSFSKDESDLIMEILTVDMSPQEKAKLESLKSMMKLK